MSSKLVVKINISAEEKDATVRLIKHLSKTVSTMSVQNMADMLDENVNRLRYIIDALLAEGRIEKIPVGMHKANYKRYTYKVATK